jgi:hypothetical protein
MNPYELEVADYQDAVNRYTNYANSLKAVDASLWKDASGQAAGLIGGRATGNMPGTTPEGYGLWTDEEGQRLLRKANRYSTREVQYSPGSSDEYGSSPATYTINGKTHTEDWMKQAGYILPTAEQIAASYDKYDPDTGALIQKGQPLSVQKPVFYEPMKNAPPQPVAPTATISQLKGGGGGLAEQERGLIGEVLTGRGAR